MEYSVYQWFLSDALFENQTIDSMERVFRPKINALQNLDDISRDLCSHLRYFVAFSSVTSGRGNVGQTNYGFANSFMERLCEKRRTEGLPSLAIQWGAIADVGVVSERFMSEETTLRAIGGTFPQHIHSCLAVFNHFLRSKSPIVSSLLRNAAKNIDSNQNRDIIALMCDILGKGLNIISKY